MKLEIKMKMKWHHLLGAFFIVMGIINLQGSSEARIVGGLCLVWGTLRFFGVFTPPSRKSDNGS